MLQIYNNSPRLSAAWKSKMIIEQVKVDDWNTLYLVHISIKDDSPHSVDHVCGELSLIKGSKVIRVPNGKPCPTNPLPKITIYNADNPVLLSVVKKITENSEPGSMIQLTAEEMKAWVNSKQIDWAQI